MGFLGKRDDLFISDGLVLLLIGVSVNSEKGGGRQDQFFDSTRGI